MFHHKHDPRIWNMKQFCEPRSGKLVGQIPNGVTFSYDPLLGHLKDCWKCIVEEKHYKKGVHHEFWYGLP